MGEGGRVWGLRQFTVCKPKVERLGKWVNLITFCYFCLAFLYYSRIDYRMGQKHSVNHTVPADYRSHSVLIILSHYHVIK